MAQSRALASCRKAEASRLAKFTAGARNGGFTLLELLVVMAVLAGLVAVAVPQFAQLYNRVRTAFERTDLERQLLDLPQLVRQRGRGGVLLDPAFDGSPAGALAHAVPAGSAAVERYDRLHLDLPPGWTMRVPKPVFYRFTGACEGGEVDFSLPPTVLRYRLVPPLCRPQRDGSDAR